MSQQFIRKVGLVVSKVVPHFPGGQGLDLSDFRITFRVTAADCGRPKTATITVFNLADNTAQQVQKEFTSVVLQAGYEGGNYGIIFQGTITQVRRGRLLNVDSFVEIHAADGDSWLAFGNISASTAAGWTQQQRAEALAAKVSGDVGKGTVDLGAAAQGGGPLALAPRGKVSFGLAQYLANSVADSTNSTWFIEDGKLNFVRRSGFLPGDIVVLTSATGLIGVPTVDIEGIFVRCLLNPLIKVGRRLQISNKLLSTVTPFRDVFSGVNSTFPPRVAEDGIYRVLVAEHSGDSRGGERSDWFTHITCLALDRSAAATKAVVARDQ